MEECNIKISASSVKTYLQCPQKYKFNYLDHKPKLEWSHLILGNLCHKTLELFHRRIIESVQDNLNLSNLMRVAFKDACAEFNADKEIVSEAFSLLKDYFDVLKKSRLPNVIGVEESFEFDLEDGITIRGFIDRIDQEEDGGYKIVDYKTTKNPKYLDDFQLSMYGIYLKKKFGEIEKFNGSYILLRHQSKTKDFAFYLNDIHKTEKKLIKYAGMIKEEKAWNTSPSPLCKFCDFYNICDANDSNKGW